MKKALLKVLSVIVFSFVCAIGAQAKTYIVAAGVSDYPGDSKDLEKCAYDAKSFKALFEDNVDASVVLLTDERATAKNITDAMVRTFANADENDIVIFYFSGHGYEGGFSPYDGNLDYATIRKAMAKSKAKNKMIFADACYSGKIRTNKKTSTSLESAKKANVMLFLSSRHNEMSLEMSLLKNGLFTHYLLKGLKGEADKNSDSVITARELFVYVHSMVKNHSKDRQHPVMWGKFSDNMPVMRW